MISAKEAKRLADNFLDIYLAELELKIKDAAYEGLNSIIDEDHVCGNSENMYTAQMISIRKRLQELGYKIDYPFSNKIKISW